MSARPQLDLFDHLRGVDKLVHEPARLSIMAMLHVVKQADFVFLQSQTGLTAGNISSHVGKLAKAGYVEIRKDFVDNRPQTTFRLTASGRAALRRHLQTLRGVLDELGI